VPDTRNSALYVAICWTLGCLIGIGVVVLTSGTVPAFFAALIGGGIAVAVAMLSQVYICGFNSDHWGPFEGLKVFYDSETDSIDDPIAVENEPAQKKPSVPIHSTLLAGETELSARKGEWRYSADGPSEIAAETPAEEREGIRPNLRAANPRDDTDDLQKISGVGPKLEEKLNAFGIFHFKQIAAWTPENVVWIDKELKLRGRIERDDWIAQAKALMSGVESSDT
jgi:predicted flap endonuclease-1-like 5' DNA nuclease